jgi:hypothetical protein
MMTYNQRNQEKTDSNTNSFIYLVVNLDVQEKTKNTYSRVLSVVLTHPDTQAQMSVANKPEFVKEFKESQVTLVGIGKGSGIPTHCKTLLCTTNRKQEHKHTRD